MLEPWSSVRETWRKDAGGAPSSALSVAKLQGRILDEVKRGNFLPLSWADVPIAVPGLGVARVLVLADALRIGTPDDNVRINVSARTAQKIADWLGFCLTTPKVDDAAWHFADRQIEPVFVQDAKQQERLDVEAMELHSKKIDERAAGMGEGALLRGVGKAWGASKFLTAQKAMNYGYPTTAPIGPGGKRPWSAVTKLGARVHQAPGYAHNYDHAGASQTMVGMFPLVHVTLDDAPGAELELSAVEVAAHKKLWPLLSHEGPLSLHSPWLPICEPLSAEGGGACAAGAEPPPPEPPSPRWAWLKRWIPFLGATGAIGVSIWIAR